jgi:hypothetical protein
MTTHNPVPISPDGEEPLSDLFGDMLNLANEVASRVSQDEVEVRLERVLRRARKCGPGGGDSPPLTVPFDPAQALLGGQAQGSLVEAQLREVQQTIAGARKELAAVGEEARRTLDRALTAYTEALKARADAAEIVREAKSYHDAALESAAAIVKDAKAAAENIKQAALEAKACHAAALESAAALVDDAKGAAESIKRAAREVSYPWGGDHAEGSPPGGQGGMPLPVEFVRYIASSQRQPAASEKWCSVNVNAASPESESGESPPGGGPSRNWRRRLLYRLVLRSYFRSNDYVYWGAAGAAGSGILVWQPEGGPIWRDYDDSVVGGRRESADDYCQSDGPGRVLSALAACGGLAMPVVETFAGGWSVLSAGKEGDMSSKIMLSESERASLVWHKTQHSMANGACVEIASAADRVAIRDSKDPDGPILAYTKAEFSAFLEGARNGEFDRFAV